MFIRVRLFLTDEVRLHCGMLLSPDPSQLGSLFLTDEVRLHCGTVTAYREELDKYLFLTDEVRLHCGSLSLETTLQRLRCFS